MTLTSSYQKAVEKQRAFFIANKPFSFAYREQQLLLLKSAILAHEAELSEALFLDLGKSEFESYLTEIGFVLHELSLTIKQLKNG